MAFDFPNSPTIGSVFNPAGGPPYTWDGEKWMMTGSAVTAFPAGTVMLFYQAAAPLGWTKLTTQNDKALRVVSGSGGVAGGTNAFSTVMAQTTVGNTTLTTANLPSHTSAVTQAIAVYPSGNSGYTFPLSTSTSAFGYNIGSSGSGYYYVNCGTQSVSYTSTVSANNTITVTSSGTTGTAHNHPITMAIQYVDVILASKD